VDPCSGGEEGGRFPPPATWLPLGKTEDAPLQTVRRTKQKPACLCRVLCVLCIARALIAACAHVQPASLLLSRACVPRESMFLLPDMSLFVWRSIVRIIVSRTFTTL
jgi:hypothetical protein